MCTNLYLFCCLLANTPTDKEMKLADGGYYHGVPFLPKLSSFLTSRFSGFVSLRRPVRRERVKKREKDLQNPEVPRMNKEL